MKVNQLQALLAVADTGNIRFAAERLGRTPSAISMTLKQLEQDLGGKLFDGERKARLTTLGRFAVEQAQSLITHHDRVARAIRSFAISGVGQIDFACPPSVAVAFLPEALARIRGEMPNIDVQVRDIDTPSIAEAVENGAIELGIAGDLADASGVTFEPLFAESLKLVCKPQDSLARLPRPIEWTDLSGRLLLDNGSYRSLPLPDFVVRPFGPKIRAPAVTSLLALVEGGLGLTILPGLCRMMTSGGKLLFLDLADVKARRHMGVVRRPGVALSPPARRLLEIFREIIAARREKFGLELFDQANPEQNRKTAKRPARRKA